MGFLDLHCHFVPGIDDGARTADDGAEMLRRLGALGFDEVVATPHMRPGLFDNDRAAIERAFDGFSRARTELAPRITLSSEHYFDETVFERLVNGEALPYPGGRAVLLEFYDVDFQPLVEARLFDLRRRRLLPVIAHPERYRKFWTDAGALERLVDQGAAALLDTAALVGKYGRQPQRAAEQLLERELYHAACSDAHRPSDVDEVGRGMRVIEQRYGADEIRFLFDEGPRSLVAGSLPE